MEFLKHHQEQLITEEVTVAKGQCYNDFPFPSNYLDFRNIHYILLNRGCTQTYVFKNPFDLIHHVGCLLLLLPLTRDFATALKPPLPLAEVRVCANLASANETVRYDLPHPEPKQSGFSGQMLDLAFLWIRSSS